jgi:class 3 adenylate cyclase
MITEMDQEKRVCPACAAALLPGGRFCAFCGAALEQPTREFRKTVTILFCDVVGSTSLSERLDPESLRDVMSRYFSEMRTCIQRHGGTIEKFIGDAVMAIFGHPVAHEDDALRAVRVAHEMHEAVESLNTELEARFLIRLALHIGVNTGEVSGAYIGNASTIASGEAVNLAALLQQFAPSGATVIGDETYRLVRDHVVATPLERVALKGKASPIPAWHVTGLRIHSEAHHLDIPFVGRTDELDHLMWVFRRVLRDGACYIASVLGDAGIGKSKLVHEFLRRAQASHGATRVIAVRCPRYGDGGPFAPLGDIFKQVLNQEGSGEHLATAVGKGAVKSILSLAGSMDGEEVAGSATETFWLVRKVLEMLASTSILLVVIEDLHWAKPGFLDLVESLGRSIREAPVVFLCTA